MNVVCCRSILVKLFTINVCSRSILKKIIDTKQTMGEIMKVKYLRWSLTKFSSVIDKDFNVSDNKLIIFNFILSCCHGKCISYYPCKWQKKNKIRIFFLNARTYLRKEKMLTLFQEASFSLAEAKFATGDFNAAVLQNVNKAQIKIKTR